MVDGKMKVTGGVNAAGESKSTHMHSEVEGLPNAQFPVERHCVRSQFYENIAVLF